MVKRAKAEIKTHAIRNTVETLSKVPEIDQLIAEVRETLQSHDTTKE